jgi:Lrp/AsnC family leucine-responsive transcriptional regulator
LQRAAEFRQAMIAAPEVQSCCKLSGTTDFIIDVVAPDLKSYGEFIEKKVLSLVGVLDASSSIVLEEVKEFQAMIADVSSDRH